MKTELTRTVVTKTLVSMSFPISMGMLSTFLFQVIDTYFVGQLGAQALAALSFSSTVYFLVVALLMGLSVGVSVIAAKAVGMREPDKVRLITLVALLTAGLLSVLTRYVVITFIDDMFLFMGADQAILILIRQYLIPLLWGIGALSVGLVGSAVLRANGQAAVPELIMGLGGIINLVLDYGFIFGKLDFPAMGIAGAAQATVWSWIFIAASMLVLLFKRGLIKPPWKQLKKSFGIFKEIFRLALPSVVTQMMAPLTAMFLTYLLAQDSGLSVAAFGVASRVETLLLIGILGVSTAVTPYIAQNLGAGEHTNIDEAIAFGGRASTYLGVLVCVLLFLFIRPIAGLFSDEAAVIDLVSEYFYIIGPSYVLYGLFVITSSIFNGLQLPFNALKIMVLRSLVFTVPMTLIGSVWMTRGVFTGLSLSHVLAGLYAAYEMRKQLQKAGSPLASVNVFEAYVDDFTRVIGLFRRTS